MKLNKGQVLYYINPKDKEVKSLTISKVGREFFYVEGVFQRQKFSIERMRSQFDFGCNFYVYLSLQDALNAKESESIASYIVSNFRFASDWTKLSIDQLKGIEKIIKTYQS